MLQDMAPELAEQHHRLPLGVPMVFNPRPFEGRHVVLPLVLQALAEDLASREAELRQGTFCGPILEEPATGVVAGLREEGRAGLRINRRIGRMEPAPELTEPHLIARLGRLGVVFQRTRSKYWTV